jgi:uncharacterized integral membrane protein (TIGR00698 family)
MGLSVAACVSPWGTPQLGLLLGIVLALAGLAAYPKQSRKLSRLLIQACIVLLGLTIDLHQVQGAGLSGLAFAAGTIVGAFALGLLLARLLGVEGKLATLLCAGTAVCGGSAIAATSSVIRAKESATSIALACVFILNAVALYLFPWLGHRFDLTQHQFGAWAAIAIHDVASVVGAGAAYGDIARDDATIIKLARVLWIIPIALLAGWWWRRHDRNQAQEPGAEAKGLAGILPWFIVLFLVASAVRTFAPVVGDAAPTIKQITRAGMSTALFLIGCGLSIGAVKEVGWRALLMATLLWVALGTVSLLVVRSTIN